MNQIISIGVGTDVKLTARLVDSQNNAINLNQVTELRAVIYNGDRQRTLSDYNIVDDTSVEFVLRSGTELTAGDQVPISMAIRYKKDGFVNSTPIIEIIHRGWVGEEISPMAAPMAVVNSAITAQFTISVPPAVYYSGASPRIGANGHWYVFDDVTKDYIDSGFGAQHSNEQIIADETERRRQEAIRVAAETQREVRMKNVESTVSDLSKEMSSGFTQSAELLRLEAQQRADEDSYIRIDFNRRVPSRSTEKANETGILASDDSDREALLGINTETKKAFVEDPNVPGSRRNLATEEYVDNTSANKLVGRETIADVRNHDTVLRVLDNTMNRNEIAGLSVSKNGDAYTYVRNQVTCERVFEKLAKHKDVENNAAQIVQLEQDVNERNAANFITGTHIGFNTKAIIAIKPLDTFSSDQLFIKYFQNNPTRTLIQIVDNASKIIAQLFNASTGLSQGKHTLVLRSTSGEDKFEIILDTTYMRSDAVDYGNSIKLSDFILSSYVDKAARESIDKSFRSANPIWYGDTIVRDFNYNAIRLDMLSGDSNYFYRNGVLKELYLVFMRPKNTANNWASTIFQIVEKVNGELAVSKNIFATVSSDGAEPDCSGWVSFLSLDSNQYGCRFKLTINFDLINNKYYGVPVPNLSAFRLDTAVLLSQIAYTPMQPLSGKKIVCFGDSVTEFGTYPRRIQQKTGAITYNVGFGGARMCKHENVNYDKMCMYQLANYIASGNYTELISAADALYSASGDDNRAIVTRLANIDFNNVDIITIGYGTNDFTSNTIPIGLPGEIKQDGTTLIGAINYIVKTIQTAYPRIRIIFISPYHRFFGDGNNSDSDIIGNTLGLKLIEYVDAIINTANENHLSAIDLYRNLGWNKYNHYTYCADGVHPKQLGYDYLGDYLSKHLMIQ